MRPAFLRALALLRRPGVLFAWLVLAVGGSALVRVPLFGLPGFELGLALSVGVGVFGGGFGIAAAFQERRLLSARDPRPRGVLRSDSALVSTFQATAAGFLLGTSAIALPFLVSTLFAWLSTACSPFALVGFFPLLTLPSALLASAVGVLTGLASKKAFGAYLRYLALLVFSLLPTLWPLYAGPQVFAFNHLLGYFPGPLYDEVLSLPTKLFVFRFETLLAVLFVWLLCALFLDMKDGTLRRPHFRVGAFLALASVGAGIFALEAAAPSLGLRMTDATLARQLGGRRESPHFVIYHPRGKPRLEVERLERDLEFQYARIEGFLGTSPKDKIRVWVYRTPAEKQALVGASRTQFAKPWRNECHVNDLPFPHPVLRHELVHVMAAPLADGPFHVTAKLGGLWPHMGVIEGLAVAGEDAPGELTLHEWAAGMRRRQLAPDIRDVLGNKGFYAQSAARAYTVAGSFVRYLAQEFGTAKLHAYYRNGNFDAAYGESLESVASRWEAFLDARPLDEASVHAAFARFREGSLFARPCAREVSKLEASAREVFRGDPARALELFERCSKLQPVRPDFVVGQARALAELGRLDDARTRLSQARTATKEPALQAQYLSEEADLALREGALPEAREKLEALLALDPNPTTLRGTVIKLRGLEAAPAVGHALFAYFQDEGTDVKLLRLREAAVADPENPFLPYLLGRRLLQGGEADLALPYLTHTLSMTLPDNFRTETRRLEIEALYWVGDCGGVKDRLGALPDLGTALTRTASEWGDRCDFETRVYGTALVPPTAFR